MSSCISMEPTPQFRSLVMGRHRGIRVLIYHREI
jgi:hypothetical protein